MALSSQSPALGVTQQVWSFGSPDFPHLLTSNPAPTQNASEATPPLTKPQKKVAWEKARRQFM